MFLGFGGRALHRITLRLSATSVEYSRQQAPLDKTPANFNSIFERWEQHLKNAYPQCHERNKKPPTEDPGWEGPRLPGTSVQLS